MLRSRPAVFHAAARALLACLGALVVGCAGPGAGTGRPAGPGAGACDAIADAVDDAVRTAATGDAQATRIDGARWLRVDRFAASFAGGPLDAAARRDWLERLRAADEAARRVEVANLPAAARDALAARLPDGAADLGASIARCGRAEVAAIDADDARFDRLRTAARVPDDYVDWQRALGLYPIAVLPFGAGVRREEAASAAAFARHAGRVAEGRTVFAPAAAVADAPRVELGPGSPRDALDVPVLDAAARAALLARHAPLWALEGTGDDDRFGAPVRRADGSVSIDTRDPTVMARVAFTRWEGRVRVQLVYTAWFPRRAPAGALDPLAGHLDGVVLRLTLDEAGRVAMVDSIHACGCWHLFVPVGAWRVRPAPSPREEWAFVPARLASVPDDARIRVRIAARTHAVEGIDAVPSPHDGPRYRLADDDTLRSLSGPDGSRRSLFDPRGLVPGTERGERWLFWPMGVPEPGAMRQWGRHATAFVGRRHFDEADLLERRFERDPAAR